MKLKNLLKKDKRGVFGLTAIQQFFAIILGIALLAYVIIIIMGTLSTATIIPTNTMSGSATNESSIIAVKEAGFDLTNSGLDGVACTVTQCLNSTDGVVVPTANYTATNCHIAYSGVTAILFNNTIWKCSYSYTYNNAAIKNSRSILSNVSTGITSFFTSISPVYAILAVLVIILVLVVLVRVVQQPNQQSSAPQL